MLDVAGAEDRVLVHVLDVHVRGGVEGAESPRLAREGDVERRRDDVQMLRVNKEDEETEDDDDVHVEEDRLEHLVGLPAERVEKVSDAVGGECPR